MPIDYGKITKALLFIAHNRRKGLIREHDKAYIRRLHENMTEEELDHYLDWLLSEENYG